MTETTTRWWNYVQMITKGDSQTEIADRAGFDKSAISRWKRGLGTDVTFIVKFARAYDRPPVEALAAYGIISDDEADVREVKVGLADLTSEALAAELLRRLKGK